MKSIKELLEQEYIGKTLEYWELTYDDGRVYGRFWKHKFNFVDGEILESSIAEKTVRLKSFTVKKVIIDGEWENEWYCLSDGGTISIQID